MRRTCRSFHLDGVAGRLVGGVLALATLALGAFLFAAFTVFTALLAAVGLGRLWRSSRRTPAGRPEPRVIEVEYRDVTAERRQRPAVGSGPEERS